MSSFFIFLYYRMTFEIQEYWPLHQFGYWKKIWKYSLKTLLFVKLLCVNLIGLCQQRMTLFSVQFKHFNKQLVFIKKKKKIKLNKNVILNCEKKLCPCVNRKSDIFCCYFSRFLFSHLSLLFFWDFSPQYHASKHMVKL